MAASKLEPDDIKLIRALLDEKDMLKKQLSAITNEKIAEKFDVSRRAVDRIENGETWGMV